MLSAIADFFSSLTGATTERTRRIDDRLVSAGAVIVHLAQIDGSLSPREKAWLAQAVEEQLGLTGAAADDYLAAAERRAGETGDLTGLLADLRHQLDPQQRRLLVAMMWRIAVADGRLHEFEAGVIERAAELLGLTPQEAALIRGVEGGPLTTG